LFHVTALNVALLSSLRLQRRVLLYSKKWDADEAMRQIVKYSVGTVSAPSAITGDLLRLLEKGVSAPSLREVGGGGAPRPESQVVGLAKFVAPGIGWGMTETNAIGSSFNGPMYVARPRCTGRMSASILWKVDEKGELLVKGGAVIEKYWPDVAARSADGWLHTGDLAVVGEDDMLEIVGRAKDMILRGGENISCPAVEHALAAHEAVLEVAVYAIPENRLGELVGATVNVRRAVTVQELREHCRGLLAAFEVPEHVLIVSNTPLPRLASEKIDKKQLQRAHIQLLKSKL
jgi:long-chain acyl-CoA synthetase